MAGVPRLALAACPGVYNLQPADAGGSYSICSSGALFVTCDLGANGDASDTVAWFVMDSNTHFQAYGVAGNGTKICYEVNISDTCGVGNQNAVTITGTESDDQINNVDLVNGYALKCANVTVNADYGADNLYGSNDTTALETLNGQGGADGIWGREGNDTINGGDMPDTIFGGPGNDTIYGGGGDDRIKGGGDNDTMYGEGGDDDVCGELGSDTLDGGSGIDLLDGGSLSDDVLIDGGDDDDDCENDSADYTTCESTSLTSCPW